jgi:hypothetical protein
MLKDKKGQYAPFFVFNPDIAFYMIEKAADRLIFPIVSLQIYFPLPSAFP